jgi:hypothetical protein
VIAETIIFQTLTGLVAGRVYPDVAPQAAALPRIVYQQVGGKSINYTDAALPSTRNGRFQIASWATTRAAATGLALQVEAALILSASIQARPIGAHVSIFEQATGLYGAYQDFDVWSDR